MSGEHRQRSWLGRAIGLGILAGVGYAAWRVINAERTDRDVTWEPQPFPFPPRPRQSVNEEIELATEDEARLGDVPLIRRAEPWIEPVNDTCPALFPVKAKLASGIFHVPGGSSYERTKPDRCYRDASTAEADGLRPAQH